MRDVQCEECGTRLFRAGQRVPSGTYLRVDDESFQRVQLFSSGVLPASFDGHVALYRAAAAPCACALRHQAATGSENMSTRTSESREDSPADSASVTAPARPAWRARPQAAAQPAM